MNRKSLYISAVLAVAAIAAWNVNFNSQKSNFSDTMLANVEALAFEVGDVPWYDFINNYLGEPQLIEVSTSNCVGGSIYYDGITISVSNCTNYSYVIYTPCYDGGNKNECTSDKKTYI